MKGGEEDDVNGELSERADISGWGVEAAQQRNKTEASKFILLHHYGKYVSCHLLY